MTYCGTDTLITLPSCCRDSCPRKEEKQILFIPMVRSDIWLHPGGGLHSERRLVVLSLQYAVGKRDQ